MNTQPGKIRFWCLLVLTILSLASAATWAQTYAIHNASNTTLNFEIMDPARGTWRSHSIYPNETRDYRWRSGDSGKVRIKTANRGYVEYVVYEGNSYKFLWSREKGMWDMRTTRRGGGNTMPMPAVTSATWTLQNRTNETLNFQTREPKSGSWRNQSAYPHESKTFRFSPGVMHGRMRISTRDRGFVEYDIRAGWGYSLVWDKHKHVWDFRTVHRSN